MTTKQLNIKNRSYYFYNDLINVLGFEASKLKLDIKTTSIDPNLVIYFIGYVVKKPEWNVSIVNPLYLIVNRFYRHIQERNGLKYLIISDISKNNVLKKYDQVLAGIKYHIRENGEYKEDYKKNKFLTDDDTPLNKVIYFPTATVIIRCVFEKDGIFYPEAYLDDCLYQI